ncbi:MAG: hypothetical protein ACJAZT_002034 [Gammaproteobacteria bacterium]
MGVLKYQIDLGFILVSLLRGSSLANDFLLESISHLNFQGDIMSASYIKESVESVIDDYTNYLTRPKTLVFQLLP